MNIHNLDEYLKVYINTVCAILRIHVMSVPPSPSAGGGLDSGARSGGADGGLQRRVHLRSPSLQPTHLLPHRGRYSSLNL